MSTIEEVNEKLSRTICSQVAAGNWEGAHAIIDQARRDSARGSLETPLLEVSLQDAGINMRTCNLLEKFGAFTVGDLRSVCNRQILESPSAGPKMLDDLWQRVLLLATKRDAQREALEIKIKERLK